MNAVETVFIVAAFLSIFSGISVIISIVSFPIVREQHFMQIIGLAFFAWVAACIGMAIGFPPSDTTICSFQAFLCLYFTQATFVWCVLFLVQYFTVVVRQQILIKMNGLNIIAWGFPCILSFGPLVHLRYGRPNFFPFNNGQGVCCFTAGTKSAYNAYFAILYTVEYITMFGILIGLQSILWIKYREKIGASLKVIAVMNTGIVATWLPFIFVAAVAVFSPVAHRTPALANAFFLTKALGTQAGTLFAIIFHWSNADSQRAWREVWRRWTSQGVLNESLMDKSSSPDSDRSGGKARGAVRPLKKDLLVRESMDIGC